MPRKSAAALATITPISDHRPPPPDELSDEQKAEWQAIVGRMPSGWFPRETHGLLVAYLRHWATGRFLSRQIEAFDPEWTCSDEGFQRYTAWLTLRVKETKTAADLATKLRLTNQSRYTPATAARQTRQPFGYIDENGRQKPWDMHV